MKKSYIYFVLCVSIGALFFLGGCATVSSVRLEPSLQKDVRTFSGVPYVPLTRLCDVYGLRWSWDPYAKTVTIEKKGSIVMRDGSSRVLVNGAERNMDRPVMMAGGVVYVPTTILRDGGVVINPQPVQPAVPTVSEVPAASPPAPSARGVTIRTIVLDAGHGGKDAGAIGRRLYLKEKDLALDITRRVKALLEARGIRVILTRSNDTFIPLPRRVEIANRSGAEIFVSIHINASRTRTMNGFECYYLSEATDDRARALEAAENASLKLDDTAVMEHSKKLDATLWGMTLAENRRESAELAGAICAAIEKGVVTRDRGTKTARFYVLKNNRLPAVLVEAGYISNRYEELKLREARYRQRIAEAIAQGIIAYKNEYERTGGFTNL